MYVRRDICIELVQIIWSGKGITGSWLSAVHAMVIKYAVEKGFVCAGRR